MYEPVGKWRVCFYLSERLEILTATVDILEERKSRQIVKMLTGPFDTPEDILATLLELIEHAEWRAEQLRMPVSAQEE